MASLIRRYPALPPVLAFAYGSVVAYVFAFLIYQRQGMMVATIDLNGFGALARSIAEGDGFSLGNGPTVRRGPLFPMLGAIVLRLFGGDTRHLNGLELYRPILLLNCLIFGCTCLVVWAAGKRLFGDRVALLGAAMCPLVPQSLRYVGMTEVETFMGLLVALLALVGLYLAERPTPGRAAAFGLTAAAATLSKPIVLLYPFAFLPLAYFQWRKNGVPRRAMLLGSVVLMATFLLPLLPWSLRNLSVTSGQFKGISSNAPGEFLRGYVNAQPKYYLLRQDFGGTGPQEEKWDPEANAYEERLLKPHGIPFLRCGWDANGHTLCTPPPPPGMTAAMLEVQKDKVEDAEVKRRLIHEPLEFVHKFTVQLATFWYIVETRKKSVIVGTIALTMLSLAAVGWWTANRARTLVWPVVSVVVYQNVIYAAFLAFARYSMPTFPTITILSAGGVAAIAARLFARSAKSSAPVADTTINRL